MGFSAGSTSRSGAPTSTRSGTRSRSVSCASAASWSYRPSSTRFLETAKAIDAPSRAMTLPFYVVDAMHTVSTRERAKLLHDPTASSSSLGGRSRAGDGEGRRYCILHASRRPTGLLVLPSPTQALARVRPPAWRRTARDRALLAQQRRSGVWPSARLAHRVSRSGSARRRSGIEPGPHRPGRHPEMLEARQDEIAQPKD